jgi:hypothetical protein
MPNLFCGYKKVILKFVWTGKWQRIANVQDEQDGRTCPISYWAQVAVI